MNFYGHVFEEAKSEAAEKMEALLFATKKAKEAR